MPKTDRPSGWFLDNGWDYLNSTPQERMDSQNLHDLLTEQEETNRLLRKQEEREKQKEDEARWEREFDRKQSINKKNKEICNKYTYGDLKWEDIQLYIETLKEVDTSDIDDKIRELVTLNDILDYGTIYGFITFALSVVLVPIISLIIFDTAPVIQTCIIIFVLTILAFILGKIKTVNMAHRFKEDEITREKLEQEKKDRKAKQFDTLYKFRQEHYCQKFEDMFNEFEEYGLRPIQDIKHTGTMEDYINFFNVESAKIRQKEKEASNITDLDINFNTTGEYKPTKNQIF